MGRIISNFFISMDGVVERPDQWHFPYFDDEMGEVVGAGMANTKAILMGRRLYDEWSQYWPAQGDADFGAVINGTQKYVLSHDAFDPDWANTTVISGPDDASVAEGQRLFEGTGTVPLQLTESRTLKSGVLLVRYAPVQS